MPTSTPSSRVLFACGTHFLPSPNLVHPWLASKLLWRILLSIIPFLNKFDFFFFYWCFRVCIWVVSSTYCPFFTLVPTFHQWKYFYDCLFLIKLRNRSIPWLKVIIFSLNLAPFCWFIKSHPFPILDCHSFFDTFCHSNFNFFFVFCQNWPFSPKSSCLHLWSLWRWIVRSQPPKSHTRDWSTWGRRHK